MEVETKVTEKELEEVFSDTLNDGFSFCGIAVVYNEGGEVRAIMGVPYSVSNNALVIGSYLKNERTSIPKDYYERKKSIPIKDIILYKRKELDDLFD